MRVRNLVFVLGDQLTLDAEPVAEASPHEDRILMIEAAEEATYVPQHKKRLVLFFSAMRHFRDALRHKGHDVLYSALDDDDNEASLGVS